MQLIPQKLRRRLERQGRPGYRGPQWVVVRLYNPEGRAEYFPFMLEGDTLLGYYRADAGAAGDGLRFHSLKTLGRRGFHRDRSWPPEGRTWQQARAGRQR